MKTQHETEIEFIDDRIKVLNERIANNLKIIETLKIEITHAESEKRKISKAGMKTVEPISDIELYNVVKGE